MEAKKSLFAAGIIGVEGHFSDTDTIILINTERREIGRGLTNFSSAEMQLILGQPSTKYAEILGYSCADEVVHRDNLVLLQDGRFIPEHMYQLCGKDGKAIGARRGILSESDTSDDDSPVNGAFVTAPRPPRPPRMTGSPNASAVATAAAMKQQKAGGVTESTESHPPEAEPTEQ